MANRETIKLGGVERSGFLTIRDVRTLERIYQRGVLEIAAGQLMGVDSAITIISFALRNEDKSVKPEQVETWCDEFMQENDMSALVEKAMQFVKTSGFMGKQEKKEPS